MQYRPKKSHVLGILMALGCAAAVAGYTAHSSGNAGAGGAMAKAADSATAATVAQSSAPSKKVANQVAIDNFRFEPRQLTVAVGTKVTWVNRDDVPHTATSTARPKAFDSKTLDTDQKFSHTFTTPGTYAYFCAVHPHMRGEIIVKESK